MKASFEKDHLNQKLIIVQIELLFGKSLLIGYRVIIMAPHVFNLIHNKIYLHFLFDSILVYLNRFIWWSYAQNVESFQQPHSFISLSICILLS